MARIRTIKPEFWQHEDLSNLPAETHMLAAALLNHCDDEGYFKANPKLVLANCFPLRDDTLTIHCSITALANIGYLHLFKGSDGKDYGQIIKFSEHQQINRKKRSKIKGLLIGSEEAVSDHCLITAGKEGKGKERNTIAIAIEEPPEKEKISNLSPLQIQKKCLFDRGIEIFSQANIREGDSRKMIGKWLKNNPMEEIAKAIEIVSVTGSGDPIPYVQRLLKISGEKFSQADLAEINAVFVEAQP